MSNISVFTEGVIGHMWMPNALGFLPRGGNIYNGVRPEGERQSLYELCDKFLTKHGGDFRDPLLAGLWISVTDQTHKNLPLGTTQTVTKRTVYQPAITPELQMVVACDTWERQYWALERMKPVIVEWDLLDGWDEDLEIDYDEWAIEDLVWDLNYELGLLWKRIMEYQAPGNPYDDEGDEHGMRFVPWGDWAGEGYFKVEGINMGWQRRHGFAQKKIEDGAALWQFVNDHDMLGHATFAFYGGHIEISYSGHDTMGGTLVLTPCPDWEWSD